MDNKIVTNEMLEFLRVSIGKNKDYRPIETLLGQLPPEVIIENIKQTVYILRHWEKLH